MVLGSIQATATSGATAGTASRPWVPCPVLCPSPKASTGKHVSSPQVVKARGSSRGRLALRCPCSAPSLKPGEGTRLVLTHAGVHVLRERHGRARLIPWLPCPGGCRAAHGGAPLRGTPKQTSWRWGAAACPRLHCRQEGVGRCARPGWYVTQLYHEHSN